jgi:hypothetical protein
MSLDGALWLEPCERELLDVRLEGNAVLETYAHTHREAIHQAAEGGAFLVHVDEYLAQRLVFVFARPQEYLVTTDACLLGEPPPLLG